jgi:hypothetical protein
MSLKDVNIYKMANKDKGENKNGANNNVNKDTNVSENSTDVNKNIDTYVNVNKSVNIIINKKPEDIDDIIRQTYYLRMSTIKRIKQLAKVADMGVSEFLQTVLDNVLDNISIE